MDGDTKQQTQPADRRIGWAQANEGGSEQIARLALPGAAQAAASGGLTLGAQPAALGPVRREGTQVRVGRSGLRDEQDAQVAGLAQNRDAAAAALA